jgi:hypothetical protein
VLRDVGRDRRVVGLGDGVEGRGGQSCRPRALIVRFRGRDVRNSGLYSVSPV